MDFSLEGQYVLLVDDEDEALLSLQLVIEVKKGRAATALNEEQALRLIEAESFTFAIVDGKLSDYRMDDASMSARICRRLNEKGIKYIRLTAGDKNEIPRDVRGEWVVRKGDPDSPQQVVQIIARIADRHTP